MTTRGHKIDHVLVVVHTTFLESNFSPEKQLHKQMICNWNKNTFSDFCSLIDIYVINMKQFS